MDSKNMNTKGLQSLLFPLSKGLNFIPFDKEIQKVKRDVMEVTRSLLIYAKYFPVFSERK